MTLLGLMKLRCWISSLETKGGNDMFGLSRYIYVSVNFKIGGQSYSYRTNDASIKSGDMVVVPAGDSEKIGYVTAVNTFKKSGVPYPVEKTKLIIRKATKEERANNQDLDPRVPMDVSCKSVRTPDGIKTVVLNQKERENLKKHYGDRFPYIEKYPVSMAGQVVREYKD